MEWTPNETQRKFMEILGQEPDGITLRDIKAKYGIEFKTGSINVLTTKGLVVSDGEKTYTCECCGHKTKVKVYKLA